MASFGRPTLGCVGAMIACAALVWGSATPAHAVLLAYEGFDYDSGSALNGLDGGTGFDGAWGDVLNQGISTTDVIVADSLTYSDTGGNMLLTSGNRMLNSGASNTSFIGRALDFRRDDTTGSTTWFSMLGVRLGMPVRGANFTLFDTTHADDPVNTPQGGAAEKINIGENSNVTFTLPDGVTTEDRWTIRAPQVVANATLAEDPPPFENTAGPNVRDVYSDVLFTDLAMFVMRIDHNNGAADSVTMWMNPELDSTPADEDAFGYYRPDNLQAAADALGASAYNNEPNGSEFSFDLMRLFAGGDQGAGPGEWQLDELRIGETFTDVAPIAGAGGIPGDFNNDETVDAADYTIWRDNLGGDESALGGNGNGSGTVDNDDYNLWRSQYGTTSAPSAASSAPEPACLGLLAVAAAGVVARRRR